MPEATLTAQGFKLAVRGDIGNKTQDRGNSGPTSAFVEAEPLAKTADVAFDCAGIVAYSGLGQLR